MVKPKRNILIHLLSEDVSKEMERASGWEALSKKILGLVSEGCRTNLIQFNYISEPSIKWASRPSSWLSRDPKHREKITRLIQFLTTVLLAEQSYVFMYFDADCSHADFEKLDKKGLFVDNYNRYFLPTLIRKIEQALAQQISQLPNASPMIISETMKKLIALVPCYSIESWLYVNFDEVFKIIDNDSRFQSDRPLFESWQADPTQIDEITQIKETTTIRDRFNGRLASSAYPAASARAIQKSFHDSVCRVENCQSLIDALNEISY